MVLKVKRAALDPLSPRLPWSWDAEQVGDFNFDMRYPENAKSPYHHLCKHKDVRDLVERCARSLPQVLFMYRGTSSLKEARSLNR